MAVLIQEQLQPDYSFVLHTSNPLDKDENVLCAEIAVGLGETLASGTRGSPWRLSVNKLSGKILALLFWPHSADRNVQGRGSTDNFPQESS